MSQKNIPDRFKLILQLLVFSLASGLLLMLIALIGGLLDVFPKESQGLVLILIFLGSIILNVFIFIIKWKELRRQEESGQIPDYQNPKIIKLFQVIFISIVLILTIAGVLLELLYKEGSFKICALIIVVLSVVERLYLKRCQKANNLLD